MHPVSFRTIQKPSERSKDAHGFGQWLWTRSQGGLGVVLGAIRATRFLAQGISAYGVGTGTRTSADVAEFASSTFAAEIVRFSELPENWGLPVDLAEHLSPYVSAGDRQEAARINLSSMRDEHKTLAIV